MRIVRLGLGALLLLAAVVAILLAADLRSARDAVRAGDAEFRRGPTGATWTSPGRLPLDPARRILGLARPLAFRSAARAFVAVASAGNGVDNGYSESQARGALEATLTKLAGGPDRRQSSAAENLLGILAFEDTRQIGPAAPAPVERSLADFQAAVELDPANADAKFNLELLLRDLLARGVRPGSNGTPGGPAKGRQGAGGGSPGRGF